MTSAERREVRYWRRKAKRDAKKDKTKFEEVIAVNTLWKSMKECFRGVGWKASTQNVRYQQLTTLSKLYRSLHKEKYKSVGFCNFQKKERGKTRDIQATHITERIVQKCLCKYLWKVFTPNLIKYNSASQKGRGVTYARKEFIRAYKSNNEWVLTYDIKSYFANIDHSTSKRLFKRFIMDEKTLRLCYQLIDEFEGETGVGLGSEISQILAIVYLNDIDHEGENRGDYGRYMDDGYFFGSRKAVRKFRKYLEKDLVRIGLRLNKKTQENRVKNGAVFLKRLHKGEEVLFTSQCRKNIMRRCKKLQNLPEEKQEMAYNAYRAIVSETTERRDRYAFLWR